jgi:hypothetical protein
METLKNESVVFTIEGIEVELISEEINEGYNTYYMIDSNLYCLGDEPPDIQTAIQAYEHFFNVKLSDSKIDNFFKQHIE